MQRKRNQEPTHKSSNQTYGLFNSTEIWAQATSTNLGWLLVHFILLLCLILDLTQAGLNNSKWWRCKNCSRGQAVSLCRWGMGLTGIHIKHLPSWPWQAWCYGTVATACSLWLAEETVLSSECTGTDSALGSEIWSYLEHVNNRLCSLQSACIEHAAAMWRVCGRYTVQMSKVLSLDVLSDPWLSCTRVCVCVCGGTDEDEKKCPLMVIRRQSPAINQTDRDTEKFCMNFNHQEPF